MSKANSYIKYIFFVIIITSCSIQSSKNQFNIETIDLQDELFDIRTNQKLSPILNKKVFKILIYTNADCGKCINELMQWQFLLPNIAQYNNEFIVIVSSQSKDMAYFNIIDKSNFKFPVFYDKDSLFFKKNSLQNLKNENRTFLLDKNNYIKLIGSPLYDTSLLETYKKVFRH